MFPNCISWAFGSKNLYKLTCSLYLMLICIHVEYFAYHITSLPLYFDFDPLKHYNNLLCLRNALSQWNVMWLRQLWHWGGVHSIKLSEIIEKCWVQLFGVPLLWHFLTTRNALYFTTNINHRTESHFCINKSCFHTDTVSVSLSIKLYSKKIIIMKTYHTFLF